MGAHALVSVPLSVTIAADEKPPSCFADQKLRGGKISELFVYDNFSRAAVDEVDAGDICAVTGLGDVSIGETICSRDQPEPLPTITVCALLDLIQVSGGCACTAGLANLLMSG